MPRIIHPMTHSKHQLKRFARDMRNNPTDAEHALWQRIRMGQIDGHRFLRQRVVDDMIVDFVCRGRRLIVEVDGGQHGERIHADQVRTKRLNRCGYRVIRFWNNEVLTNIDGVLLAIRQALQKNTIPPSR